MRHNLPAVQRGQCLGTPKAHMQPSLRVSYWAIFASAAPAASAALLCESPAFAKSLAANTLKVPPRSTLPVIAWATCRKYPSNKYAKISQSIRQISLNFSQNFAPPDDAAVDVVGLVVDCLHERGHDGGRLLGGDDVEVEREDLVALCNGDAFGVSETTERRSRKHHYTRGSSWPFRARRTAPAPGERSARGTPA